MAASKESLGALHTAIAEKLTEAISEMPSDGKGLAALLSVARQFVKDNGIEAVPAPGSATKALTEKLNQYPFDPQADGVH
jgi:hypothetical protein